MARRKRQTQTTEEDQMLIRNDKKSAEQQAGSKAIGQANGDLAPAQLQQLQRQFGNAYVQRYVADQQPAETEFGTSEPRSAVQTWLPEPEPIKFQSKIRMVDAQTLEFDLNAALQSEKMGLDRTEFSALLKKWAGIGLLNLSGMSSSEADDIKVESDGRLQMPLSSGMAQQMRQSGEEAGLSELAKNSPFGPYGAEVEANLFFSRETLLDMELPDTEKFLESDPAKQSEAFLLLNLEGTFLAGGGNSDVQKEMSGFLLLGGKPK